jgi:hypothetical protein
MSRTPGTPGNLRFPRTCDRVAYERFALKLLPYSSDTYQIITPCLREGASGCACDYVAYKREAFKRR